MSEKTINGHATHEISVRFSDEAYGVLEEMARRRVAIDEFLREAVALEKWYLETKENGGHILVRHKDGDMEELVYP